MTTVALPIPDALVSEKWRASSSGVIKERSFRVDHWLTFLRGEVDDSLTTETVFDDNGLTLKKVRRMLRQRGISYADIGQKAGYSTETVRAHLTGRRKIMPKTMEAIILLIWKKDDTAIDPRQFLRSPKRGSASQRYVPASSLTSHGSPPPVRKAARLVLSDDSAIVLKNGSAVHLDPYEAVSWRSLPPDPMSAETVDQFHARLSQLRVWAGGLSLRQLEARNPADLPRSTLSDMFRRTDRLPKYDLLQAYVRACGAGTDWPRWDLAWQRLKNGATARP